MQTNDANNSRAIYVICKENTSMSIDAQHARTRTMYDCQRGNRWLDHQDVNRFISLNLFSMNVYTSFVHDSCQRKMNYPTVFRGKMKFYRTTWNQSDRYSTTRNKLINETKTKILTRLCSIIFLHEDAELLSFNMTKKIKDETRRKTK